MKKNVMYAILICGLLLLTTGCGSNKYKLDSHETVAYTTLRLANSKSAVDGSGEISSEYLDRLKSAIKNFNKESDWFDNYTGDFYGKTMDTSDNKVDLICNTDYCAKITVKEEGTNYYLVDYSFEKNNEKDYSIITITK